MGTLRPKIMISLSASLMPIAFCNAGHLCCFKLLSFRANRGYYAKQVEKICANRSINVTMTFCRLKK